MTISSKMDTIFTARFVDAGANLHLELTNEGGQTLRHVEILTIFLKDEETQGGPSRSHISFETSDSIRPKESLVVAHRTWIDGKRASPGEDQLRRLQGAGPERPYVLDISWQDTEGKTQYQRIPVGY